MKKVAIFGAGEAGKWLYHEIRNKYEILGFIDNFQKGSIEGIKVYSPKKYFESFGDVTESVYLAAGGQKTLKIMINTVKGFGQYDLIMMQAIAGQSHLNIFDENGSIINNRLREIRFSKEKPTLPYFEVPITDDCNLNCKGCLFACNSLEKPGIISLEQIKKDASRMRELFYDIPWIRILGGEPLLHPDLIEILEYYRELFPDSELDLCTNGLLIQKMSSEFFECMRNNRISIHVSGYKPIYKIMDSIDDRLEKEGLVYAILNRDDFLKYYTTKNTHDANNNYEKCIACACPEVYDGRLFPCSAVIAFEKFNRQFKTNYGVKKDEDWLELHDADLKVNDYLNVLDNPIPLCGYCDFDNMITYSWESAPPHPELSDYII